MIIAPSSNNLSTTKAFLGGKKLFKIFEPAVVKISFVLMASLIEIGTPSSFLSLKSSKFLSIYFALSVASFSQTVISEFILLLIFFDLLIKKFVTSVTDISFDLIKSIHFFAESLSKFIFYLSRIFLILKNPFSFSGAF